MQAKHLKFVPSGEEKAFIHQQISDLKGPVLVLMEKIRDKGVKKTTREDSYTATLILDPLNLNLKAKGRGDNIFEALIQAKETVKRKLSKARLLPASTDDEREFFVEMIKRKTPIH